MRGSITCSGRLIRLSVCVQFAWRVSTVVNLEVSVRMSFLSGRPFTPYDEAVSTAQRRGVYDLTRVNAERAPDYGRIDMRVDRTFTVHGQPLNLFFGVQNLTNRRNFASYNWNRRTNSQQFGEQQGIFPILGLDWRF